MIVVDTHAWLWWISDPGRLSAPARGAIERADRIGVCTISCWEVATLVRRGRIELDREVGLWVRQALIADRMEPLALTAEVAVRAGSLGDGFHGDPADRIVYATARSSESSVVTRDAQMRAFDRQRTIW